MQTNNFVKKWMDRLTKPVTHVDRKRKSKEIRGNKHKGDKDAC